MHLATEMWDLSFIGLSYFEVETLFSAEDRDSSDWGDCLSKDTEIVTPRRYAVLCWRPFPFDFQDRQLDKSDMRKRTV